MCINQPCRSYIPQFLKILPTTISALILICLGNLATDRVFAACLTCPQNASDTASGSAFAVHVFRNGIDRSLGEGAEVGSCELLHLQSLVQYAPVGTSGGVGSGFTGGTGAVFIIARGIQTGIKEFLGNVTPPDMGTTLVTVTNPLDNPNLCSVPAGMTAVEAKAMLTINYTLTPADIAAGSIRLRFEYTGTSLLQDPGTGQCLDTTDQAQEKTIRISPPPKCDLTKHCLVATNSTGSAVVITYSGTVSNSGSTTLTNISVVNNQPAPNTVVFTLSSLPAGQSVTFTNSYTNTANLCGPYTDVLALTTQDLFGCPVTNSSADTCTIVYTPGIKVSKFCPTNLVTPGSVLNFSGVVSNSGNVVLTNVVVSNDKPGPNTILLGPITLGLGQSMTFTRNYTVPLDSCGPYTDTLTAIATSICGVNVTNRDTANCPGTNSPAITVTKKCPPNPVPPGGILNISGVVSNSGNITLTNVTVTNQIVAIGQIRLLIGPTNLAPGASLPFTDSYTVPLDSCGPYRDTVVAQGADKCFGRVVLASDTKDCPGITTPRISLVKHCPANPVEPGGVAIFSGTVSNAGNITLTNVVVVNNRPTNNTPVLGPVTLAPGQAINFTGNEDVPLNCCEYFDTLTATSASSCTGSNVTATASAACPTLLIPKITVSKSCPPVPVVLGQPLVFSGVVSNSGNIALSGIMVVDNQPSNNTPVIGPLTLAPGETASFAGNFIVPINICDTNISDTVTARGADVCRGSNVVSSATASCPIMPTPRLTVTKRCPPNPVAPGDLLIYTGTVSNSGTITITNVTVVNDRPVSNTLVLGPITLVPGQATDFSGNYRAPFDCCGPCVDTLTARGNEFCFGSNVIATASAACPRVTTPRLAVTRDCPPGPVSEGDLVFFTGLVTNSGNATLANVTVIDDQAGDVLDNLVLAPGETAFYLGMYLVTNCGPNVASAVTAFGSDVCTGVTVSNRFVTACSITCPPTPVVTLFGMGVQGTNFVFSFATEANQDYTVQFTDSLNSPNWQSLKGISGDGSVAVISDPIVDGQRFYRVLIQ